MFGFWRCQVTSRTRSITESTCPTSRCSPFRVGSDPDARAGFMRCAWFVSQGRVRDIVYKGREEQLVPAVMPDGKVPLVGPPAGPDGLLRM